MDIKNYTIEDLEEVVAPASSGDQPLHGTIIAFIIIVTYS